MRKTIILLALFLPLLAFGGRGWDVGKFYRPKHDKRLESWVSHVDVKKGRSVLGVNSKWLFGDFPIVYHYVYDHTEGDVEFFKFTEAFWLEYGHNPYSWVNVFYEVRELNGRSAKSDDTDTLLKFAKE